MESSRSTTEPAVIVMTVLRELARLVSDVSNRLWRYAKGPGAAAIALAVGDTELIEMCAPPKRRRSTAANGCAPEARAQEEQQAFAALTFAQSSCG
jgi:hypothetical protein